MSKQINLSDRELHLLVNLIDNEREYMAKCNRYREDKYYELEELVLKLRDKLYEKTQD